jgi:hypothetical protein
MKENPPEEKSEVASETTAQNPRKQGSHQPSEPRESNFPDASQANFRVACNEVAEQLSKNWRFRLHVGGLVVTALFLLAAAIGGIVGLSISATLVSERQRFQEEAKREIGTAKQAVEAEITQELKKENVQKTMEVAAGKEAAALLAKSVARVSGPFNKS